MESDLLFAFLGGVAGVTLVNAIKNWLGWEGNRALLITYAVSFALALVYMAAKGQLQVPNLENIAAILAEVFAVATAFYKLISKPQE